jgi:hypothetical protein
MIESEINEKVSEYIKIKEITNYESGTNYSSNIYLSGGSISDTFIKKYEGEAKDYDFFITNVSIGLDKGMNTIHLKDVLENSYKDESETKIVNDNERSAYGDFFKTKDVYKIKKAYEGEEISVDLILSNDVDLEFDLSFREFYYSGDTILASAKALRDIENNQISVNSLKTPRQTYYRLKEYEERFGMSISIVEEHILIKRILEEMETGNKTMDFNGGIKTKYYTAAREKNFHKEAKKNKLTHEIYTRLLKEQTQMNEQRKVSIALEKARMMYELGMVEKDFEEVLKIKMPKWKPRQNTLRFYTKYKTEIIEGLKKYNKTKKMNFLYSEDEEKAEWLRGPFSDFLATLMEEKDNEYRLNPEEVRFALFADEDVPDNHKFSVDEHKQNSYLGNARKAKELINENEMNFKINIENIYSENEAFVNGNFYGNNLDLVGENDVNIIITTEKEFSFYTTYGYLDKKRVNLLMKEIYPSLNKMKTTTKSCYRKRMNFSVDLATNEEI